MSIKLLDTIYKLTDNADKLDGKHASDFATSGHTHSSLSTVGDKRAEATTPNSYSNKFIFQGLKTNSSFGSPSTDTYSYILGLRGWSDSSGGNSWELAFNNSGIYSRNGASTSWGSWYRLLDSSNSSVSKSGQTLTVKINGTSQSLSNTTYSAGTGLSLSGTTFNHASSVTAGTAGTSSATSGSTLAVPYVTYNATGHITATGTHTHTITGFASSSHNHDGVYLKLSGGTLTGNFAANNNTKTPFNLTTNLYYVNKALNWGGSSYIRNVILLIPVQTSTNWSGYNYIDGKFLLWKSGGNMYDVVEVNLNNVYNSLEYRLLASGQHSSLYKLCICKYNGVSYYAIDCPYHANPYNNAEFYGHIRSSLTGGTGTVNLPLTVDYYNENTQTVLNSEVKNSITSTLTTSVVTSVSSRNLFSIAGFSGSLSGNASSASKLGTNAGSATNPVYFSGGVPVACTYSLNKTVPSNAKFTDTNTTYSAGTGISLSGTTFSNSGVRSVATGDNNGTIKVNTNGTSANVAVKGLGSAAYLNTTGTFSAVTHSDYNNNQTQLVSRSFMSYWTGAYNSSGTSNLTYCKHGAFGTAATKAYTTSVTSGSGSLVTSGGVYTALQGYSTTSHNHDSVYAAKSHTHSYVSYGTVAFTPKNEAITPAAVLALTGNWSLKKGTWDYSGNGYVTSDFGNIDLAGTSVLTFGTSSAYTQLYITAPTQSGHSGITNEMLFYNDHGSSYSPGWTRVITNRNYTSYCAKASHSHSYASKVTVGSTAYSVSSNNITIPAYPTSLKCPSSLTIQTNGTSQGAWNGSSAKTINITYSNVGAAAASHTHSYLPLSGGTMTGNIKVYTDGDGRGLKFGTSTLNSLSNQLLWQSAEAIRFGSSSWDWNAWAGLKYNHSSKIIYLGLADGTVFNANSGQSGGKLYTPGISNIYIGNGTYTVWHSGNFAPGNYMPKSGGAFTGSVTFANGTWNVVGDDAAIGDYNAAGMLGLKSCNNNIPGIGFHNSAGTLLGRLQSNGSTLQWNDQTIIHSGNIGSQSVNYANYAAYLPPLYIGGQQTNPQTYFNNGVGVRVAMTGMSSKGTSYWSDTLWINGYSGGDVPYMCALHFNRDGSPRAFISAQSNQSSSYGTFYEFITGYNIGSQSVNYANSAGNANTVDGYHISVGSSAGSDASTIYYVV